MTARRYFVSFLGINLLGYAQSDSSQDSAAVRETVAHFYSVVRDHDGGAAAAMFTEDGDIREYSNRWPGTTSVDKESGISGKPNIAQRLGESEIWSESRGPQIRSLSVRMISSDVAIADVTLNFVSSVDLRRAQNDLLILKRVGAKWLIAAYRQSL